MSADATPLRLAIVGLGKMGQLHCATWRRIPGVRLTALVDSDPAMATWAAEQGVAFANDCRALHGTIDLAVIATPSAQHLESALPLLEAGIHCLVEKPLALDFAACRQLVSAAQQRGVLLAVGHSERFNPAIHLARNALSGPASQAEVVRAVPRPRTAQTSDCDVVQDLMVHDLDWLIDAFGPPQEDICVLAWRSQHGQLSHVRCQLTFAAGRRVDLTACREGDRRQRQVLLRDSDAQARVINLDVPRPSHEPDALTRQALAFLQALDGKPSPIALGRHALAVMDIGDRIRRGCQVDQAELA